MAGGARKDAEWKTDTISRASPGSAEWNRYSGLSLARERS
jgi:hypothetical protein